MHQKTFLILSKTKRILKLILNFSLWLWLWLWLWLLLQKLRYHWTCFLYLFLLYDNPLNSLFNFLKILRLLANIQISVTHLWLLIYTLKLFQKFDFFSKTSVIYIHIIKLKRNHICETERKRQYEMKWNWQ